MGLENILNTYGMAVLPHFLSGAAINEIFTKHYKTIGNGVKEKVEAGILSCMPDIDMIPEALENKFLQEITDGHRGYTHSFLTPLIVGAYTKVKYGSFLYGFFLTGSHLGIDVVTGGKIEPIPGYNFQMWNGPGVEEIKLAVEGTICLAALVISFYGLHNRVFREGEIRYNEGSDR